MERNAKVNVNIINHLSFEAEEGDDFYNTMMRLTVKNKMDKHKIFLNGKEIKSPNECPSKIEKDDIIEIIDNSIPFNTWKDKYYEVKK